MELHVVLGAPKPADEEQSEALPHLGLDASVGGERVQASQRGFVLLHVIVERLGNPADDLGAAEQFERGPFWG